MTIATARAAMLAATLLTPLPMAAAAAPQAQKAVAPTATMAHGMPNASYTVKTGIADGKTVYIGKGGSIDGQINPTLTAQEGDVVQITLVNGEGMDEHPEYFTFNGAVAALTTEHPLRASAGDSVRIFFGVGGPNFTSSFHVIGTIFNRAYLNGSLESPPLAGVQTVSVPPGDAAIVDLSVPVPGKYILVDHALTRMERGLVGALIVDGKPRPDIYRANDEAEPKAHAGR